MSSINILFTIAALKSLSAESIMQPLFIDNLIYFIDLLGTVVFAFSGVLVAGRLKLGVHLERCQPTGDLFFGHGVDASLMKCLCEATASVSASR